LEVYKFSRFLNLISGSIFFLICFSFILACVSSRARVWEADKDDGIIYFEKDEPVVKKKSAKHNSHTEMGKASYYGDKFHGRKTASGEIYDHNKFTAAHPTLKFGTLVRVTNLKNDLRVTVRINDRGPFSKNRIIDLSKAAAKKLKMIEAGVVDVLVEIIQ